MSQTLELQKAEPQPVAVPEDRLNSGQLLAVIERAAHNPDIDVEKMERLLAMHERIVARQAENAFNAALKAAQEEMPRIHRDANNPTTNSRFARLETLNKEAVPIYTKHGFSLSFGTADSPDKESVRITCVVSHKDGHSRNYQLDVPLDVLGMKGNPTKTRTHGFGSTLSYGRRYLTLLIFNVSLTNEDDDGNQGKTPSKGPRQATPATRVWMLDQLKDIHVQLQAYGSDRGIIMPDQSLDDWPLENVPTTKPELAELRKKVEAHQ